MPRRACFHVDSGRFSDNRNQRSARKHRDVVLPHCGTGRSTLCVSTGFPDSSRCEHKWTHATDLARATSNSLVLQLPGCAAMPVLAALVRAEKSSAMTGLSDRLSSLRRNTAVHLNFNVARQLAHHPDRRAATEH